MSVDFPFYIVDMSHKVSSNMVIWPRDPETENSEAASIGIDGYYLQKWKIGEHTGTHIGTPSHFVSNGRNIDEVPAEELITPLVVIDKKNGKSLTGLDVQRFEDFQGEIPGGATVVLNTGWAERWPDPEKVFEKSADGKFIYPGFTPEAVDWLITNRNVCGLGTDAPGIDPGYDSKFLSGTKLAESGKLHLENLTNLDVLPVMGVWIVIGALNLSQGSGSPARVLGLIPK